MWSKKVGFIHPTSVSLLHVLIQNNVSLVLSMPFGFNLGFGSYKHIFCQQPQLQRDLGMCWCPFCIWVPGKMCGVHCPSIDFGGFLCFLELEDFLLISICRQINGNIIDFPWKKNLIYLRVASICRPLCESGPIWAKNAGGFKRDSQEDAELLQSRDRKAQHTAWRHWALLLWGDQAWGHQGPEPAELAANGRDEPSTSPSTPVCTELFQHTPSQHIHMSWRTSTS